MIDVITQNVGNWFLYLFGMVAAAILYLVRLVFTNQGEIKLLKQKIESDEEYRKKRDERIESQLNEVRLDIKEILKE